jgi:serine/threonine protein kinase
MSTPQFPRMFGKYALLRPFARGGMGEICLAALGDMGGLEKLCLVKKVLEADDQPSLAARLLDEAKVAVRLNHANLVQVFDAGKVDEELYIAMELIEGRDMRAVWNRTAERRSRIPLDVALYVVREMARGLEYAHNYGGLNLVHRDIAPPNILMSWHGEVKITDFGLARSILKSEKTAPGIVYGRIAYLAPEQARGEQADKRTDLYAVGVILWELLTGRPLHETTDEAVKNLEMARHPRIEPPSHFARGIAPTLDAIALKALAIKRDDRYSTAEELRRGLSEELARVAPTTDASRLATWLSELFEEEIKTEANERERMLREELPKLRARLTFQVAAVPPKTPTVVKAQSLDLHIAGVDRREIETDPGSDELTAAPLRSASLPGVRPTQPAGIHPAATAGERPPVRQTGRRVKPVAQQFDDEGETRVHSGAVRGVAQPARAPAPLLEDNLEPETLVGEVVDGRYKVERLLGTGGMGAVYEAEHIEIGKKVALKVLHPQFSRQADLVARFRREARAASKVGHPNIVDVTDSGTTENGDAFFVMERLDGTDLADVLRHERRLAVERTVAIGTQVCRALHAAHQAGIIHRDLKPENIFLVARDSQPDFVKVLDFGIAKSENPVAAAPRRLTTPGIAMGTPEYMAPEQAAGKSVDGRVDVYSVGAILYEMLVGEPPHAGNSVMDILAKKATQEPAPIRPRNKSVSEQLERVILAALEREPEKRPQTMAALEYELNKCVKGRGSAVAAVLGIKPSEDGGWGEETSSRTSTFGQPAGVSGPRHLDSIGAAQTMPGSSGQLQSVGGIAELLEPVSNGSEPGMAALTSLPGDAPDAEGRPSNSSSPTLEPMPVPDEGPSAVSRILGILGGLAFLAGGGYLAYTYVHAHAVKAPVALPTKAAKKSETPPAIPTLDPTTGDPKSEIPAPKVDGPPKPTGQTPDQTTADEAEVTHLLEWAKRSAEGGRIITPPGDNLKELLDRIEKASPGNAQAAELRQKTTAALGRRGVLALKKQRLEEAEDAFRALVILKPEDEWGKGKLARTLALRSERNVERHRYTAAIADANQALEILPDDIMARISLADAYLATGKREQAAEEYKRVLELRPADKRAKNGLTAAMAPAPPQKGKPKAGAKKKR